MLPTRSFLRPGGRRKVMQRRDGCPETKTSFPALPRGAGRSPRPAQAAPAALAAARLAVQDAPQSSSAQEAAETAGIVGVAGGEEDVAARPVTGTDWRLLRICRQALTLGPPGLGVRLRASGFLGCAARRRPDGHPLAITACLLLALRAALAGGSILLLGPPAAPASGLEPAGGRAIATLRSRGSEPAFTALEQTTACSSPGRPWRKGAGSGQ